MAKKFVYLVTHSEQGQGGSVQGVFSTADKAVEFAHQFMRRVGFEPDESASLPTGVVWWEGGDRVSTHRYEVK